MEAEMTGIKENEVELFTSFESFFKIVETLHSTLDPNELESKACNLIHELLRIEKYVVLVYDPLKDKYVFACSQGYEEKPLKDIFKFVIENKSRFRENSILSLPEMKNTSALPLFSRDKLTGVFCGPNAFVKSIGRKEKELLSVVSASLLYAYTNSTIYEMTKKLAVWDNKTRLYNYRYFLSRLSNEVARARRYGRPVSVVVLDINNFKEFNDKHGHIAADRVLAEIARTIKSSIRVVDIPSRFGGDEFLILLPETDIRGARVVAERLKRGIESQRYIGKSRRRSARISISYGIAQLEGSMAAKELLEKADADVYRNKNKE